MRTHTSPSMTLVESVRPPKPHSITAQFTFASTKARMAASVSRSKRVVLRPGSECNQALSRTNQARFSILASINSLISWPPNVTRSVMRSTCGEENRPQANPARCRPASIKAPTDPFPFVPAIWIVRNVFCGLFSWSNKSRKGARSTFIALRSCRSQSTSLSYLAKTRGRSESLFSISLSR